MSGPQVPDADDRTIRRNEHKELSIDVDYWKRAYRESRIEVATLEAENERLREALRRTLGYVVDGREIVDDREFAAAEYELRRALTPQETDDE